jgi:phage-related protein
MNEPMLSVCFFRTDAGSEPVRKMSKDLWEVRIHLEGRIARILFTVEEGGMVLLHGFIKKSQSTPPNEL